MVSLTSSRPISPRRPWRTRSPMAVLEALATPHGLDRYLELVHPMLALRELRAEVTGVRRGAGSVTVTLRPTRHWRGFQAGQFVSVTVDVDGVRRTRCYSPASSQHRSDGRFELTVKAHGGGVVSAWLYANARRGMVVGLSQAQGEFMMPARRPARVLLISGGSGITPVMSMLRTLVDEGHDGEIVFLHYCKTEADVAYLPELRALAAARPNVRLVLGCTASDGGDLRGRFDETHLAEAAPWHTDAPAYLCGPTDLASAIRAHYADKGVGQLLHTEAFAVAPLPAAGDPAVGNVRFADTVVANSGATLLEQAEAAGLSPDHGCRMGICFSCTQVKRSGLTRDVRTNDLHAEADSEIQLCVSVPVGDVDIDL